MKSVERAQGRRTARPAPRRDGNNSAAARPYSVLVVEVPSEGAGRSLIDHLSRLHAEFAPLDDAHCTVRVELKERTIEALIDALKLVRRWQSCVGVQTLRARFGAHVYRLSPE
jgi:hypothetical protein